MSPKLLKSAEVADRLGITLLTLYRHIKDDPDFPPPIRISRRVMRFHPDDVDAYVNKLRNQSRQRTAA